MTRMKDILDEYHDRKLRKTRRDHETSYYKMTNIRLKEILESYKKKLSEQAKEIDYLKRTLQEHKDNWAIVRRSRLPPSID